MTFTLRLIAGIQAWLLLLESHGGRNSNLWDRLGRAEEYLIRRHNRDETTLEEQEAFDVIWPPIEIGGES